MIVEEPHQLGNNDSHHSNWNGSPAGGVSNNNSAHQRTDSLLSNRSNTDSFNSPTSSILMQRNVGGGVTSRSSSNINPGEDASIENILHEYTLACQVYGCVDRLNPGILTTIRFSLPTLRVSGNFFDADMLALAEVLLKHCNGALRYIRRLDFSLAPMEGNKEFGFGKKGIRSHGAYALSRVLQMSRYIEEVFLPNNRIGPYGASAIFCAARTNPTLRTLLMRGCRIGERGAFAFVSQILMPDGTGEDAANNNGRCGLREVDLSVNRLGFYGVFAVEKGLKKRIELLEAQQIKPESIVPIEVDLEGNMVFQEVMNCITHGLGIFLAMIGTILLSNRVRGKPRHYILSCAMYSVSLIVLYLSSTLFHSFFALQRTRYIFQVWFMPSMYSFSSNTYIVIITLFSLPSPQVFDMCAIYILIAGSYTPFLLIALHHKPMWSNTLLAFIWLCSLSGIGVEAMYPLWKHKPKFSLVMYLGMGWSCMICMKDLVAVLPTEALYYLVAGGVAYTGGVPFFVRNNNLDHSIWHCFVMAGSILHWMCVYMYVVKL